MERSYFSQEVSLEPQSTLPKSTAELVGMLKQAGTDLTVRYLTGQMTFEAYSEELEKSRALAKEAGHTSQADDQIDNLADFDQMMEEDYGGEDDEEDEEDEGEELAHDVSDVDNDDEKDDGGTSREVDTEDSEFVDAGEISDDRDSDWTPGDADSDSPRKPRKKSRGSLQREAKRRGRPGAPKRKTRRRKPKKMRKKKFELPPLLANTNGQAMLLRAQGKTEEAIKLLHQVVSLAPRAAAPYEALGNIQEEKGNLQQALKFYMVAANLKGSFATEWLDLVEMCLRINDEKLAMTCFVKGLHAAPSAKEKLEILTRKCAFFEQTSQQGKALQVKEQMLSYLSKEDTGGALTFARDVVRDYLEIKDESGAISALMFMLKEFPEHVDSEDINSLSELLISQGSYLKALEVMIIHCGVTVLFSNGIPAREELPASLEGFGKRELNLESLQFPQLMPIDLRCKLALSFILTRAIDNLYTIQNLISSIVETDKEQYGDVHFEVADAMVMCGYHDFARPILYNLVHSQKFNKAAVWLTYGRCLNAQGDLKEAIEAYTHVVSMAPAHYDARMTLSSLHQQMGHNDIAIQVLSKGPSEELAAREQQNLQLHKCNLLYSQGRYEDFIKAVKALLTSNLPEKLQSEFLRVAPMMKTVKSRRKVLAARVAEEEEKEREREKASDPDYEPKEAKDTKEGREMVHAEDKKYRSDLWEIFLMMCKLLFGQGRHKDLLSTATLALACPIFTTDHSLVKETEFICLKSGAVDKSVYHLARNLIGEEIRNNQAWNLYNYVITRLKEVADLRFTMRLLMKNPQSIPLGIINGNERMMSGTYTQALGEYMNVFKMAPDNTMVVFCAAVCLVHIASRSFLKNRNMILQQTIFMLNLYKEMRGECQETYYNLGRAMYQLNIQYAALQYFKKALEFPPSVGYQQGVFDMSREIAYCIAKIYQHSGNSVYARYYLEKYCVV